ncbi:MAG: prepilin-type N-terminal cleavage/methylation domain-containing protein [Nitrospirota bacterium]
MAKLIRHIRFHVRGQSGVTLIELVITIVIVGIIAATTSLLLLTGVQEYVAQDARATLTTQGRLSLERMAREIRLIRSRTATDIPTMTATTLSFVDISGNAVTYTAGGGSVTRNGAMLASSGSAVLTFSYVQQDGTPAATAAQVWVIQMDLTFATGNETQSFRVRVHPRNFT